ncbi:allantoinase [Paenibacillus sp. 1-18]|uniref:allantoinase n=1 Tax=Paenibacillus sp. 1-18 TaxID=1333846 RepID=UPI00046FA582|nr:allantoinase [Paenibacillus sp. 1-18]
MTECLEVVIRGGQVVLPDGVYVLDIGIKNGKIHVLQQLLEPSQECKVIDASGQFVLPGMIDVHVHFNEPALGVWEGFVSGSASLAAGGCTAYIDMPLNGRPPTTSLSALNQKSALAYGQSYVDYAFWGGLVPGNLKSLEALAEAGVAGFKAFMSHPGGEGEDIFRGVDDVTLYEGMQRIAAIGGILALHAESEPLVAGLGAKAQHTGKTGFRDYAASRPVLAELEAVHRALFYAKQTGCALHFVHISNPQAVELIDQAKRTGMNVTLETCPHYLMLTCDDMGSLGTVSKCAPPLRSEAEREEMWKAIAAGKIDMIASDHSPCPNELKRYDDWFQAWGGISGAQSSMELILDEGHLKRKIPLPFLSRLLSENPARRFGLFPRKGTIQVGMDADLTIFNLNSPYTLTANDLYYRHKHSPYVGRQLNCRVTATLCRGEVVYRLGEGVSLSRKGMLLHPFKRKGGDR